MRRSEKGKGQVKDGGPGWKLTATKMQYSFILYFRVRKQAEPLLV